MEFGKTLFNDNWRFLLADTGSCLSDAQKRTDWHDVEIPHDWLIGDTRDLYRSGDGWYKKTFTLTKDDAENMLFIDFEGVYMDTTVFVNEKQAGEWKYGYSSFSFDISDFVAEGENTVMVRVCHKAPNTRWYSGAGIFRDVYIRKAKPLYIAEDGIYISSANTEGLTFIETEIKSRQKGTHNIEIIHTIINAQGKQLLIGSEFYSISYGETVYDAQHMTLPDPILWSNENPYLYTLKTQMLENGAVIETQYTRYGYRSIEFSPQKGFFLNGKPLKLHGVCMHHDLGALGSAVNYEALKRQVEILMGMGVNSIRTSHNMSAKALMDMCDEMGILVDSEAFDMWELPKTEYDYARFFPKWYDKDVTSWIRRDRNHPCIIMWSVGNEIYDTHKSLRGLEVAKMLKESVWYNDPYENASATVASNYMRWENAQIVADEMKICGYNYTEDMYDKHHEEHPDWFIYGSETASTVRSRGIYHLPANTPILAHDDMQCSDMGNSVVGWGRAHESAWIMDRDREYCGGQYIWTGFDYIGEPTPYSTKNSYFGIVDTAGFPKDAYYLYKAVWTDGEKTPFIHIFPYWDWNIGQTVNVFAYSNVEDVELFLNGKSLGRQHIDLLHGNVLHADWELTYEKGELVAKAYDRNGNAVAEDRRASFGEAAEICVNTNKTELKADGRDMIFAEISVCDKNGEPVANARNRIKVRVSGAARLVGLDNGDSTDYDSYKGGERRLFSGKLLAMIEATFDAGDITVSLISNGIPEKTVRLNAVPCEKPVGISVVDGFFPVYVQPEKDEIPVRKIELNSPIREFNENNSETDVEVKLLPENATYSDLTVKCVFDSGIETNIADAVYADGKVHVKAKGDGNFRLRVMCANGCEFPQTVSDLEFTVKGLGEATRSAYKFTSASLFGFSNIPLNIIERGAIGGIISRSVIGFKNVDFGSFGSDKLRIYIGNSENAPVKVEVWLGDADNGGELLTTAEFPYNCLWDNFAPVEYTLPKRVKGLNDISFVVSQRCIFGGFDFVQLNRAFQMNSAVENDSLYGDEFTVNDGKIEHIGNNVLITFNDLDFEDGAQKVIVSGKTPNDMNSIQLRSVSESGEIKTQLLEFPHSDDYTAVEFPLEKLAGKQTVSFVFLPGSNFDFEWFRFTK